MAFTDLVTIIEKKVVACRSPRHAKRPGMHRRQHLVAPSHYCSNRPCSGGACSESIRTRTTAACARAVAANQKCGTGFSWGEEDGWCDCSPAGRPCEVKRGAKYNTYRFFAAPASQHLPLPSPPSPSAAPSMPSVSCRRLAVVLTVSLSPHGDYKGRADRVDEFHMCRLRGVVASLRAAGFVHDVVCQAHGFGATELESMRQICSRVLTPRPILFKGGPGGDRAQSYAKAHRSMPPPAYSRVQSRRDGNATALKLHAWRLTEYEALLLSDVDVLFLSSPTAALHAACRQRLLFGATPEVADRGYSGLNSHLVLMRPSADLAAILAANSERGHFIPYTLGEQDVIESLFPPVVGTATAPYSVPAIEFPRHLHGYNHGCFFARRGDGEPPLNSPEELRRDGTPFLVRSARLRNDSNSDPEAAEYLVDYLAEPLGREGPSWVSGSQLSPQACELVWACAAWGGSVAQGCRAGPLRRFALPRRCMDDATDSLAARLRSMAPWVRLGDGSPDGKG